MHICENRGSHLFVGITEPFSVKIILSTLIQEVADTCRSENLDKVLVDMSPVSNASISILDRYQMGVKVARVIGPKIKVAVVAQKAMVTHMAETAAVNRYGKMKMFSDMDQARLWLGVVE